MQPLASEALDLARAAADPALEALALVRLGIAAFLHQHDPELARRYYEEALALCRKIGDHNRAGMCLNDLGEIPRSQGDYAAAARYYQQSLEQRQQAGDGLGQGTTLFNLGEVAGAQKDYVTAARCHQQGLEIAVELDYLPGRVSCLGGLGFDAAGAGDLESAHRYLQQALSLTHAAPDILFVLVGFAWVKMLAGQPVRAAEWLGLATAHPASETDVEQRARTLLADLRAVLPAAELDAALARGAKLDLDAVVGEILGKT